MEVQEAERRFLAGELHDEIGQVLTALRLVLDAVERKAPKGLRAHLGEAQKLTNDLLARVRSLSLDLRPTMLDDLGLLPTLLWLFDRYTSQTGVQVAFAHNGLGRRFAPDVETAAFRIVQEGLTNVARHAGVSRVTVRAWADGASLEVQITDEGRGFDADAALANGASSGLAGMRERAVLLGGSFSVESASGRGACLSAHLPLPVTVGEICS
jgi:signal transduction histidine kinase